VSAANRDPVCVVSSLSLNTIRRERERGEEVGAPTTDRPPTDGHRTGIGITGCSDREDWVPPACVCVTDDDDAAFDGPVAPVDYD